MVRTALEFLVEGLGGFLLYFGVFVVPLALGGLAFGILKIWRSRGL